MSQFIRRLAAIIVLYLLPGIANGQVTANFTVDHTSGCVPLIVHFTNTSTGATSYSWNFGNSSTSTLPSPSGTSYLSAGTYTVTLTAYNGPSSSTHTSVITVNPLPTTGFSTTDTAICPNVPVNFINTSTAGMPGAMTYNWNFGDGATSTLALPSHPYTTAGFYTITLYATNAGGCTTPFSRSSYIHIFPTPIAGFSSPLPNVCATPASIAFSNSSTGAAPLSYVWTFGDGGTNTAAAPSHTYATAGSFNVKLNVTSVNGCKDSVTRTGYVNVGNLTANFTSVPSVCVQAPIGFTNTSGPHISSQWKFGDGNTSTDENPSYAYTAAGTYSVKLRIYNGSCYDSITRTVTVNPKPTINFSVNPAMPCPATPFTQTFTATMPAGSTAKWSFIDSPFVILGNPVSHSFTGARITPAKLIVTDLNSCVDSLLKLDTLNSLNLAIGATSSLGCIPLTTSFYSSIFSTVIDRITPPGNIPITLTYPAAVTSYTWNYGDGSPTSSSPSPTHIYTTAGIFVVNLTVGTANGCSKTASYVVKAGTPPAATFTATPTHVCVHRPMSFTATPTAGTITYYDWQFGDGYEGGGASTTTTTHSYDLPGTYTVVLTPNNNGCPAITPYKVPIVVDSPGASTALHYLCTPFNGVQFFDFSPGETSRTWFFGDGDSSNLANPVHYYSALTYYPVKLATYNSVTGCRDTAQTAVSLTPVTFNFDATDTTLCPNQLDTFVCHSLLTAISAYRWSVDDTDRGYNHDSLFYATTIPGFHNIRLIITDFRGCYDTLVRSHYIHVANPKAIFTASIISGCAALPVTVTDHSTDDPGVSLTSYAWNFGDGVTAIGTTASHTYTAAGTYSLTEAITDGFGCTDSKTTLITAYRPSASFHVTSTSVCKGTSVHFINTSSDSGSLWVFGDGGTSTATSPYHTYTTVGTYTVRLVSFEPHGCSDTLVLPGYITVNPIPVAGFTMSDTFAVCPPLNVTFTNTSTGASSYYWTFGTGAFSTLPSPGNPYTAPGSYTIKLAAINSFGCSDTARHTATVFGYTGAFTYATTPGCLPLAVHFTVTLGSISSKVWDFSDGYVSSATSSDTISHSYTTPGRYVPKLILTDTSGCTNFSMGTDTIMVNAVNPGFTISPNSTCENSTVSFSDTSHSYFSTVATHSWAFGGTSTATGPSATHTYTAAGVYTVALTATDAMGCTGTIVKNVTVNPAPAAITGNHPLCSGFTTSLSCSPGGGTWTSSSTAIATVSSTGILTGVASGTAIVTYALTTGCKATIVVTVTGSPAAITGTLQVCLGQTTALGNPVTGGTWYSSATGTASVDAGGIVTGISPGSAMITYTLPTGCQTWNEITVNPVPGSITGSTEICIGSMVTMSDPTPSGTWTSSTPSIATIGTTSGVVTGVSNGTATITYKLSTGCIATTVTTVNTAPPAITGLLFICGGHSSNLTDPMPGGTWSCSAPPGVAVIHPTTGVITGYSPGTVTVSYTVASGCVATAVATISPLPAAISGTTQVCAGASTTLASATTAGTWTSSNTAIATIAPGGLVTGMAAGTATISYTIPTGCFNIVIVTVDPLPSSITGADSVCEGGTVTFANSTPGGIWTSASTLIANIDSISGELTGITNGSTLISYSLSGTGCYATKPITVNTTPTSITGASTICNGSSATLLCTPASGIWTSSNPAIATVDAAGIVNGLAGGAATITYGFATGGCMTVKNITVNPLPPVHGVTGGGNYCAGATGVHIGLDGSDAGVSYTLYLGTAATGIVSGSGSALDFGLLTGAGVYTVQATDTATGCMRGMTGMAMVTITPTVVPTITMDSPHGDTVCQGLLTTFVTSSTNGGTAPVYAWSVNGAPVAASGASYTTVPANGDVITVKMSSNALCAVPDSAMASLTIIALPGGIPTVSVAVDPGDTVCEFTTTNFTASSTFAGAGSYAWFVNGATAGSGTVLSYLPNSGDIVRCRITSDYLCRLADTASSSAITITAEPKLAPHVTVSATPGLLITEGAIDTLIATVTDAGTHPSYQWYLNAVIVPAATTNMYISQFKDNDSIACRVLASNVCSDESVFDGVIIQVKQPEPGTSAIGLYPNPNNGTFTIKGNLADTTIQSAELEIVNVLGQKVLQGKISATKGRINEVIQMPDPAGNGVYLLKIIAGHEVNAFHVILDR